MMPRPGPKTEFESTARHCLDGRRAAILRYLLRATPPVPLSELATYVLETAESTSEADREEAVTRLEIRLHHVDLPYFEARGLLDYDADQKTVSTADPTDRESAV